jgi:hypothetical protein
VQLQRIRIRLSAVSMRQSTYVSIRQHTSAYVSIRQHTSAYVSIRQHASAYVSIRQNTLAFWLFCVQLQRDPTHYSALTCQLVRCPYLYFCTSKASKLSTCAIQLTTRRLRVSSSGVRICTFVPVKQVNCSSGLVGATTHTRFSSATQLGDCGVSVLQ